MRRSLCLAVGVVLLLVPFAAPRRARSQPVTTRVFEGLDVGRDAGRREALIRFSVPIRYLRHTPQASGDTVQIQFLPLEVPLPGASAVFQRESLQIPPDFPLPIAEVTYDGLVTGQPSVVVRFERSLRFEVRQGEDLRSLVIAFPVAATPAPSGGGSPAPADDQVAATMAEARRAMTAGDVDRAILIYTKVLSLPENSETASAQELLAFAYERKGRLAHAKAEYETYLERFPDGEGADRVRQRLDALVTARATPTARREPKRPPEEHPLDFRTFGSLYVGYRRELLYPDQQPDQVVDSTLFSDYYFESRLRTERYTLRSQLTGGYRHEFLDGGSDEPRTNSLFLEGEDHVHGLRASIGRRSLSTSGVLGRYDGARLTWDVSDHWTLGTVAGFPVDSPDQNSVDFDRYFSGVSIDVSRIFEGLDAQVYAIGQMDQGTLERAAVGGEMRYFAPGRFLAAFVDYDVYFRDLNLAQLVGNWQVTPSTLLTTYLDHRLVPTLTLQNALQGTGLNDISDLLDSLSKKELKQLAEDRTARATSLNFGVNQSLGNERQISFDFGTSHYSGTDATEDLDSGGVIGTIDGISGTGFEFAYGAQFIQNNFLKPAGIGIVGLRFLDGSAGDLLTGTLDARYPITRGLRANPRLRLDYRMHGGQGEIFSILPSLRLDYRIYKFTFDADFVAQWQEALGSTANVNRWGYSMTFGLRYDY